MFFLYFLHLLLSEKGFVVIFCEIRGVGSKVAVSRYVPYNCIVSRAKPTVAYPFHMVSPWSTEAARPSVGLPIL